MEKQKTVIVPNVTQDELWKGIIESMFEDFLHFFFPNFVEQVDFEKPYEFLNRELQELIPASQSKNRKADLLVKVFLKSGEERWLLIHIEVQGYEDPDFPLRMYVYNYRIFDRFNAPVMALAILTDDNPNYYPSFYERKIEETIVRYDFKTYKLLERTEAEFENSTNLFAAVMQIARTFIRKKPLRTDEDLLSLKLEVFSKMLRKGFEEQRIRHLANFIKLYVFFKDDAYFSEFEKGYDQIIKTETAMEFLELIEKRTIEAAEKIGEERGIFIGRKEGRLEGRLEGRSEGISQGLAISVKKMLAKNFSVEVVADVFGFSTSNVKVLAQELEVEAYLKQGLTVEETCEILKASGQEILLSERQLAEISDAVREK